MSRLPTGVVTLLFTDIEGSTRLLQRLGDPFADALRDHRRMLRAAFESHGGIEVDTQGDAFFVVFHDPADAVRASEQAQRALAAHTWPSGVALRVRMGIHTGEPRLVEDHYVGLDVHRTARVMAAGHGGQVLLSERTRRRLGEEVALRDLGEHRLKDLLQPERLYQLVLEGMDNDFPALKTLGNHPTNLPIQPTPLIGRDRELAELAELVDEPGTRLLTLVGPGGSGKTRLALQLAADLIEKFRSGCFFVSLAPISTPDLVASTVAQALAVREQPGERLIETLGSYLRDKQMLLVMDNFEQVVDAAPVIAELLASCPEITVLVTSRQSLHLRAERVFEVLPLSEREALDLFVARAQAARADFLLAGPEVPVATEICARLDRLPLAIELAAARVPVLPLRALVERLARRLPVLATGPRDAPERQRTLRAAIAWSYDLLDQADRRLFARLGVFVGGGSLGAAEAVYDATLDGLQSLLDKSLLRGGQDPLGESRYWMLETIREFALEQLDASGQGEDIRRLHAAYFTEFARKGEREVKGNQQREWLQRLETEHDNVRAALRWTIDSHEGALALRLAGHMAQFWWIHAHAREGQAWLEAALELSDGVDPLDVAHALDGASSLASMTGNLQKARAWGEEELRIAEHLGDPMQTARSLRSLAETAGLEGRHDEARELHERILGIVAELGDDNALAATMYNLGEVELVLEHYGRARELFEGALARARAHDQEARGATFLMGLGTALLLDGRPEESVRPLVDGLRLFHERGFVTRIGSALMALGMARATLGEPVRAARLASASDRVCETAGITHDALNERLRQRLLELLRTQLDPASLETAWAEGQALSTEDAVREALAAPLGPGGGSPDYDRGWSGDPAFGTQGPLHTDGVGRSS